VGLNPLLTGRGLEVDDLLDAANGVCPCREHQLVADWNVPAKCHVMLSLSDFEQPESADALLTAIAAEELVRLRKVGAIALFWSGMPYPDLGRSPHKTLGRPTGRVKAFCVPSCVPNSPVLGGATVCPV
jgi:hypothetical protein